MSRWLAEATGTFALVLAGTGAIVVDGVSGGRITHVGIALVFGLVVLAMIQAFGDVSGAHLNPAVTLGFALARRLAWRDVLPYALAQCAGALAASGLLRVLFHEHSTLGATMPSGAIWRSFVLECATSWLLMLVILSVSSGSQERGLMAGIAVGAVVALEALFAGPISGASMNPARSLAPAIWSGRLDSLWIYIAGPLLGMMLAVPMCSRLRPEGCCGVRAESRGVG